MVRASPRAKSPCRQEQLSLQRFHLPHGLEGCSLLLPTMGMENVASQGDTRRAGLLLLRPSSREGRWRVLPTVLLPVRAARARGCSWSWNHPKACTRATHRPLHGKGTSWQEERPAGTRELWLGLPGTRGWPKRERAGAAAVGAGAGRSLVSRRRERLSWEGAAEDREGKEHRDSTGNLGGIYWCRNASGQVGMSWFRPFILLLPRWLLFAFRKRALVDGQKRGWDWAGDL